MSSKKSTELKTIKDKDEDKTASSEKITLKEFEKMVLDLAKKGLTSEKIGEELRKQKIHPREFDKKISKILKENDLYVSSDLKNAEEKFNRIKTHLDKNKQDKRALNEKSRIFAQIRKIKKYNKVAQ